MAVRNPTPTTRRRSHPIGKENRHEKRRLAPEATCPLLHRRDRRLQGGIQTGANEIALEAGEVSVKPLAEESVAEEAQSTSSGLGGCRIRILRPIARCERSR